MAKKNRTQQPPSFGDLSEQMAGMKAMADAVQGFVFPESIVSQWLLAGDLIERGEMDAAFKEGRNALHGLKLILSAFLRNSLQKFFAIRIKEREDLKYDEDILAGIRKRFRTLEDAVRLEANGSFTARVQAYTALYDAVAAADVEQQRRDEKRAREQKEAEAEAKRIALEAEAERNRAAAELQRQRQAAIRKEQADKVRAIFA